MERRKYYQMEKIKSHWVSNSFTLIRLHIGWSFYPITYKDNQYVVEFITCTNVMSVKNIKVIGTIYEYGVENKLFRKYKRNRVFSDNFSVIFIDNNKSIDLRDAKDNEIKMYLPQIISSVFQRYEFDKQEKKDIAEKIYEVEKWNGVIEE